jgi:hypothetical protein
MDIFFPNPFPAFTMVSSASPARQHCGTCFRNKAGILVFHTRYCQIPGSER